MDMSPGSENRQHPRVEINWPVTIVRQQRLLDGMTENISNGGAFVRCKGLVPKREILGMTLMPPNYTPLKVTVETVWADMYIPPDEEIKPIGVGARFVSISDVDRQYLSTVLSHHHKSDSGEAPTE